MMTARQKLFVNRVRDIGCVIKPWRMVLVAFDMRNISRFPLSFRRDVWNYKVHPKKFRSWQPKTLGFGR
jgi:hypothetical protein